MCRVWLVVATGNCRQVLACNRLSHHAYSTWAVEPAKHGHGPPICTRVVGLPCAFAGCAEQCVSSPSDGGLLSTSRRSTWQADTSLVQVDAVRTLGLVWFAHVQYVYSICIETMCQVLEWCASRTACLRCLCCGYMRSALAWCPCGSDNQWLQCCQTECY